jgi:hypothetical protein
MRSFCGHEPRLERKSVRKGRPIFLRFRLLRGLKRELLEAVARRNPGLHREFISEFIIESNKCK